LLRAVSNGVLRDLNIALVGRHMMLGARSIYVDFVDYDEVAHHAGGNRLEALKVLESLDQVLRVLQDIAQRAPRRYHFVILSDHGQSQGVPFEELHGKSLGTLCSELTKEDVVALEENVESWGRVESVLDDLASTDSIGHQAAARAATRVQTHSGPGEEPATAGDLVVLGSGNLGLVYSREPHRLVLEEIDERWPKLIPGLATAPGIGFVAVQSRAQGHVVIGAHGSRRLEDGVVDGIDPLLPFGGHAAWALLRAMEMPSAPDIYVNSEVDPATLEISAFEGLVGAHGGLGGWQDRGVLLAPAVLLDSHASDIRGAEQLHAVLVSMLVQLGHRSQLPRPVVVNAHG
jgi:hypothetical protein